MIVLSTMKTTITAIAFVSLTVTSIIIGLPKIHRSVGVRFMADSAERGKLSSAGRGTGSSCAAASAASYYYTLELQKPYLVPFL